MLRISEGKQIQKEKKEKKKTSRLLFFKTQVIKLFSESLQRGACSSPATPCFTFTRQTRIRSGSSAGEPRVCFSSSSSSSSSHSCYGAEQVHGSRLETRVCSACWTRVGVEGMTAGWGWGGTAGIYPQLGQLLLSPFDLSSFFFFPPCFNCHRGRSFVFGFSCCHRALSVIMALSSQLFTSRIPIHSPCAPRRLFSLTCSIHSMLFSINTFLPPHLLPTLVDSSLLYI